MKWVFSLLAFSFPFLGYIAVGLSSQVDFGSYENCLTDLGSLSTKYKTRLPGLAFQVDRNLGRSLQRIPLMAENLDLLRRHVSEKEQDKNTIHLVDNATFACWQFRGVFERQARSLYLFLLAAGATLLVLVLRSGVGFLSPAKANSAQPPPQDRTISKDRTG